MHATQAKSTQASSAKSPVQRAKAPEKAAPETLQKQPVYAKGLPQRKVAIGSENDSFEKEADSVAQKVASGGSVAPQSVSSVSPAALSRMPQEDKKPETPKPIQKAGDKKKPEEQKPIQKAEAKNAPGTAGQQANAHAPEAAKETATAAQAENDSLAMSHIAEQAIANKGAGRPLNPETLQTLTTRMGTDLKHVTIHDDAAAQEACRALHARAFTHGSDIWLGVGESDADLSLMAHEVTHVLQQTDHIHRKMIQRGATQKKTQKPIGKVSKDKVEIPIINLPKFKADGRDGKSPYVHKQIMNVQKRPDTKQKKQWVGKLEDGIKGKSAEGVKSLFAKAATQGVAGTKFFTTAKPGKKANLKQWSQQNNAKAKKAKAEKDDSPPPATDVVLFGTQEDILKEVTVPYWNKEGKEHNFDIDHIKEMQLGGEDDISNYELLDWQANRESGTEIRNELLRRFKTVLDTNEEDAKTLPTTDMDKFIEGGGKVEIKDFKGDLKISAKNTETYWSYSNVLGNKHIDLLRPMTPEEVGEAGLTGSETELAIYSSRGGGRPRLIPWDKGIKGEKSVDIKNFYYGFHLKKVKYGTSDDDKLIGELILKTKVFQSKKAEAKDIETDFEWKLRKSASIKFGGYIDDTQILPTLAANFTKANALSPIEFDGARLDDTRGIVATGSIHPDVSIFKGTKIDFMIAGSEVRISKLFTAGEVNVPKPFHISGASLEIFASTLGYGLKGGVNFGIDKVGTGYIEATASTGKSLAEAGISLAGYFDFDPALLGGNEAHLEGWYRKDGNDYDYGMEGDLKIKEGKIKGVKKAELHASYIKGKFSANGTAELTISGVEQVSFTADYDAKEGLIFTGAVLLKESKFIKSGSGTVVLKKKDGEELHVSAAGKVVPKVGGISAQVGFSIDGDLYTVEGTATYEKGKLKGAILIGITNRPVSDEGKPGEGKPTKEMRVYGGGAVTLKLASWLEAMAGIKLLANGEIEVVGKIGTRGPIKLFDEKVFNKNLLSINIDIPIIGVSALGHHIGIFATIGGGLDLSAGIGKGMLDADLTVDYNPAHEEDTHVVGRANLHVPAHAGLRLFVHGGLGVGIPIVDAKATIEVGASLGLEGALDLTTEVDWSPQKGLVIDAVGSAFVEPKFKFDVSASVLVELDLLLKTVTLYEETWELASFEWGSGLRFGLEFPVHYEEGKAFDISMDNLKFTTPNIDPLDVIGGVVEHIVG